MTTVLVLTSSFLGFFSALDKIHDGRMETARGRLVIAFWLWLAVVSCCRLAVMAAT